MTMLPAQLADSPSASATASRCKLSENVEMIKLQRELRQTAGRGAALQSRCQQLETERRSLQDTAQRASQQLGKYPLSVPLSSWASTRVARQHQPPFVGQTKQCGGGGEKRRSGFKLCGCI